MPKPVKKQATIDIKVSVPFDTAFQALLNKEGPFPLLEALLDDLRRASGKTYDNDPKWPVVVAARGLEELMQKVRPMLDEDV